MSVPKRAAAGSRLFRGSLVLAAIGAVGAATACGASNDGATPVAPEPMKKDRTEVTMVLAPGDAGSLQDPQPTATASSSASSAPSNDPSDVALIGGPQEPEVEKAVAPVRPRIRACYKKALAAEPSLGGTATFDCIIGKDGHVASVRPVKREGLNDDVVGCLTASLKAMTFDGVKKSHIVALTLGTAPSPTAAGGTPSVDAGSKR